MTTQPLTKSEVQSKNDTTEAEVELLHISTSPHIRHPGSVPNVMMWVIIALVPSIVASYMFFGWRAIFLTCVGITSAVLTEWLITLLMKKPSTIGDFSAVITGILLAFNVPPSLPWWMVAIGAAFAIGVAKMAFGGLGGNFINPALAGRAFLMASYPAAMTSFTAPKLGTISGLDGITSATPLAHFKLSMMNGSFQALDFQDAIYNLFTGNVGGCIGETSAIALLLGAMILWYKRIIGFAIPLFYIGTVFVLFWLFNGTGDLFTSGAIIVPTYQILAGGLLLGAFFMATDMVTSPITPNGKIVFGIGCGVLTFVIRKFGGYPEGVSYSILLMNLLVPLIEKYTRPRIYGRVKK
ncbi:MAG TPA: RnfABCDGE type electron transport complex subunit D [Chitinispirillaceae bacterium]|nr:RnfABCDGE type electron transport complex subunit D [Chitinispirillaceae bacterium]